MREFCLNPLSVSGQYHSVSYVEKTIRDVIHCFQYIRFALATERIRLIYDDSIEMRSLMVGGQALAADLHRLPNGDLKRQWYIYTRNKVRRAEADQRSIRVSSAEVEVFIDGQIRGELFDTSVPWLSFGGTALCESEQLQLVDTESGHGPIVVVNAFNIGHFSRFWPKYEASPKHRKDGYHQNGNWVSPMPLDESTAQNVLMTSVEEGKDRYARHNRAYYRFPRTHQDQEVFHGFEVTAADVPNAVLEALGN